MDKRIKQHIPITGINSDKASSPNARIGNPTHIQLEVYYDLGGINCFSGQPIARGYYISALPVEMADRGNGVISIGFVAGRGVKSLLMEVNRKTDKQLGMACTLAADAAPRFLEWCNREYGIVCEMPDEFFPDAVKLPVSKTAPKIKSREAAPAAPVKPIRGMKLLTAEIIRKLEKHPFGSQDGKGDDAKVLVKFFGGGSYTFLVTEGHRLENGDWEFFGKATMGYEWEWGYVLLSQLEAMKFPPFGLGIERDMYLESHATVGKLAA